jgi:cytochrome c peroxidase
MDPEQQAGFEFFTGEFLSDSGQQNCVSCHSLPSGTNRLVNFEGVQVGRDMKTAQLRNVYQKVGRFNASGPQVAGFGLLHDGTFDTVMNFLRLEVFFFPGKTEEEKDARGACSKVTSWPLTPGWRLASAGKSQSPTNSVTRIVN